MEPIAKRPDMGGLGILGPTEGTGLLPWEWAAERLEGSYHYWLGTVCPDGRPHVTPVWCVWYEDALWFGCDRHSRKARNLRKNPAVTATTDDPWNPVIVEGRAALVDDMEVVAAFASQTEPKYGSQYGSLEFYGAPSMVCVRIDVTTALGLTTNDFWGSPTRWTWH